MYYPINNPFKDQYRNETFHNSTEKTIDQLTAETKLMLVIRHLIIFTQNIRPEDIESFADYIHIKLIEYGKMVDKREKEKPPINKESKLFRRMFDRKA